VTIAVKTAVVLTGITPGRKIAFRKPMGFLSVFTDTESQVSSLALIKSHSEPLTRRTKYLIHSFSLGTNFPDVSKHQRPSQSSVPSPSVAIAKMSFKYTRVLKCLKERKCSFEQFVPLSEHLCHKFHCRFHKDQNLTHLAPTAPQCMSWCHLP